LLENQETTCVCIAPKVEHEDEPDRLLAAANCFRHGLRPGRRRAGAAAAAVVEGQPARTFWSDGDDFPKWLPSGTANTFLAATDHNVLSRGMQWIMNRT
jgi:hypothetical protein